ncbi:MAG: hypothetical protein GY836_01905, partial [Herbaspirillum sp.]|uniref:hypothetical protein n=1 Tax=Herbaspirillum sp. TaxID=1890675 RepID=UPI002588F96B
MARPDKIDHPWAGDGGDVTPAPSDDKRDVGFVNGDRPYKQYFNRIMLECQEGLNNVITEGPGSWYPDASNINTMLMTGQWDEAWGQIGGAVNTIEGGTHEWTDTCLYFDSDNVAYILVSDIYSVGEGSIKAYNTRTGALTATSNLLADDLPSGGTEKWEAQSMCCDGVNVYVVLTDTDATPDEHIIQAWTVDLESSNWATPWGGTGTSLSGTGNGLDAGSRDAQVIIADDDHIAVSCGWIDITAAGDAAIQLFLRSDGSAVRDGSGDCTTGASYQPIEGICSDGTNIFFVAYDDTSETL